MALIANELRRASEGESGICREIPLHFRRHRVYPPRSARKRLPADPSRYLSLRPPRGGSGPGNHGDYVKEAALGSTKESSGAGRPHADGSCRNACTARRRRDSPRAWRCNGTRSSHNFFNFGCNAFVDSANNMNMSFRMAVAGIQKKWAIFV